MTFEQWYDDNLKTMLKEHNLHSALEWAWQAAQEAQQNKIEMLVQSLLAIKHISNDHAAVGLAEHALSEYRGRTMTENLTREDLLLMVANQMKTIHQLHCAIGEALQAIDSEMPDLAWRRLLQARDRFNGED